MSAILVTGGAGFIGSHLAVRLLQRGEEVIILDNLDPYYDVAIKQLNLERARQHSQGSQLTIIEGDIRDHALVQGIFAQHNIRKIAHLASLAGVRYSIDRGDLYAAVNTMGSVMLMNEARQHGVELMVQASTSSIYGQTTRVPFVEDDAPDFPLSPYAASKRAAEIFAHSYHVLFGFNVTSLRFFNVYGPFGRPDMMPLKAIRSILAGETITLYDPDVLRRDWTYIDDTIDGVIAALNHPLGYEIFNLGSGNPVLLKDFFEIYQRIIGKQAITVEVPAPSSEPKITYCDNTRAREKLGFHPQTDLETGLTRTWEWYKTQYL